MCNSNGVYEKLPYFQGKNNPENSYKKRQNTKSSKTNNLDREGW
jgi:hypothetical protein